MNKKLSPEAQASLLTTLQQRFQKHMHRHPGIYWSEVAARLLQHPAKLWSLNEMERTGGEPDVTGQDAQTGAYLFCDCAAESPKGRRSLCYDQAAREERKENKPEGSATEMAAAMGIALLTEDQYRQLQTQGALDTKTSSWIVTPEAIRKHGGALFADYRYEHIFIYHNGAQSYYAARGFRGMLHC